MSGRWLAMHSRAPAASPRSNTDSIFGIVLEQVGDDAARQRLVVGHQDAEPVAMRVTSRRRGP